MESNELLVSNEKSNLSNKIVTSKTGKKTILFSPAAASFDQFKNFEERGRYFNQLLKVTCNIKHLM